MSYILDALKKVERDRRRAHVPSLATMHAVPVERRPVWPWIAGGALALNVLGFAVVLALRPSPMPTVPPPPVVAPAAPVVQKPAPAATDTAAPSAVGPVVPPAVSVTPESPAVPTRAPIAVERPRAAARRADAPERPAPLKLEVLIYSDQPESRAAYINGQRYVEGQRVDGRALLEAITSDSVVLVADGKRIILKQQ